MGICGPRAVGLLCCREDFTNYLPKLQSSTPALLQRGRAAGGKRRRGKKKGEGGGRESKGKEGEGERARDAFQSFSSNWMGGSWAQCEIIEVKGGSPSLVRKW